MASEASEQPITSLPDDLLLRKVPLEVELDQNESISCISSHKSNLYFGTTKGKLLHYYIFDDADEYILILKTSVQGGQSAPVTKLLVLPDVEMCLVLCNRVVHIFTLPELSPCHIGNIKDASDISQLAQVRNPKIRNKHDKIIVYTSTRIRVVQLLPDVVKLLRDINYAGSVVGLSSAAGTLANYSNICLVANDKNYDVVDLQKTRRISLFDYNPEQLPGVEPHIVPFKPQNPPGKEEYMLTICSDSSNSMAMFMNSLGDVTRGTLAWINIGYPYKGVAVQWPYVIGLFSHENRSLLAFSSLTTLEVTCSVDLEQYAKAALSISDCGDFRLVRVDEGVTLPDSDLLELLMPVDYRGIGSTGYTKQFSSLSVIFYHSASAYYLHKPNELVQLVEKLYLNLEENNKEELQIICDTLSKMAEDVPDSFSSRAHVALQLVLGQQEDIKADMEGEEFSLKKFDPRLFLLFDEKESDADDMWKDLRMENALLQTIKKSKTHLDSDFKSWLIQKVHSSKESYSEVVWELFRKLAYEESQSTANAIQLVLSEKTIWQDQSEANDRIYAFLESSRDYLTLFQILEIKQETDNEENAVKIIDLGLSILSGALLGQNYLIERGTITSGNLSKDLVLLVFFQLRNNINDSDEYTKKLLELLKLYPDQGLELLQAEKGGKHKSTHRYILQELSSTHNIDTRFSSLKVEYLEQSLIEQLAKKEIDLALIDELFAEMVQYIETNMEKFEVGFENLNILSSTFRIETSQDTDWPKLSWIEFLHLHGRKGDSKEIVEMYLKFYELLVIKSLNDKTIKPFLTDKGAFSYLCRCFTETSHSGLISYLLEQGDYGVAEWVSLYGKMSLPRKTIFLDEMRSLLLAKYHIRPKAEVENSINQVVRFYLEVDDLNIRYSSVRHLVSLYGEQYFDINQLLALIPDDFPVVHLQEYLTRTVLDLEAQKTDSVMKKMMSKMDAKFTAEVCQDFQECNKGVLEL